METVDALSPKQAWIVAAEMGLGHLRAAFPLRDIAYGNVLDAAASPFCSPGEYRLWERMRRLYYFLSRAENIPVAGKHLNALLHALQNIPDYYPRRDLSLPDVSARYLSGLIRKSGLGTMLADILSSNDLPAIHTFFPRR
jgi:hypothetical protein